MKSLTLIFYGTDGDAAKALANTIRKECASAQIRHAYAFDGAVEQDVSRVITLPCMAKYDADRIAAAYGDIVVSHSVGLPLPPPPPPPPAADPLTNLPVNWKSMPIAQLKKIAAAVGDGRAVDNAEQAIAVIEAALAARK